MKVIRISKTGWIYIILIILLGIAAINTGNNLVYLITSFLLGVMGASGYFGKTNISNLKIELSMPNRIFANNKTLVYIHLKNKKKFFPSFLLKVKSEYFSEVFTYVDCENIATKTTVMVFPQRGFVNIDLIKISSKFPFNFFERYSYINTNLKFLIYPEPIKKNFHYLKPENGTKGFNDTQNVQGDNSNEIHKIRNFLQGDNFKFIHWKLSAKYDKLMVKEYLKTKDETLLIDFYKLPIKNIELKLSALTYLIIHNKNVALKINGKILRNTDEMLSFLALY